MNFGEQLERAEIALGRSLGRRAESEVAFVRALLSGLGYDLPLWRSSPAQLFRMALGNEWRRHSLSDLLRVIATPCGKASETLQAGDWMIRVIAGSGDIGHICVLASGELLNRAELRAEGIPAESSLPGYYGAVIEGGAYPHKRDDLFARRFLDRNGRVPPHSVILRPLRGAGDETPADALPPSPATPSSRSRGQKPTGPLVPAAPAGSSRDELRKRVTLAVSGNSASARAFSPERNDKSGVTRLVAKATFASLLPPTDIGFRWRSNPPDGVAFGQLLVQQGQGFSTLQIPVMARRPGRARVFVEALDAAGAVIETSAAIDLSVPQFFVVTDSDPQLQDLPRILDGRQIVRPAALDSALREMGLLDDKLQIFSQVQTTVDRIAGPRAVRSAFGCAGAHNVRFIWRMADNPEPMPAGLTRVFFTQVDLQGYPPRQRGPEFGITLSQQGPYGSAENPAELITIFPGMFEMLLRENSGLAVSNPEDKDLRGRMKTLGAYWRTNSRDACARALMRNVVARGVANTICHEAYHSLLTIQQADQPAMDPGGHLRASSILSVRRDFNARTGIRVTKEREFPAPRSYVLEEPGIGEWQTLPAEYDRRIWTFFPTPPQWPEQRNAGETFDEDQELSAGLTASATQEDTPISSDYSLQQLASGQLGAVPSEFQTKILGGQSEDVWGLTDRIFAKLKPEWAGVKLDPKNKQHQEPIQEYRRVAKDVAALIWLRKIIALLDKYRGDLPRDFLLGWMAKENDGQVSPTTSLGERGYFQVHPEEATLYLGLSGSAFEKLSTDRETAIREGIKIVRRHRAEIAKYGVTNADLLLRLTKTRHGLPANLRTVLDKLSSSGSVIGWNAVAEKMKVTALGSRVIDNVESTMGYAKSLKVLSDLVPAPAAGVSGGGDSTEDDPSSPSKPKCGFLDTTGAVVAEADVRKAIVTAANDEHTAWLEKGKVNEEDNDARFPDLVRYWLAGMDSSLDPDTLSSLQGAVAKVRFTNIGNSKLNTAIADYNTADDLFDKATDAVYASSNKRDAAQAAREKAKTALDAAEKEEKEAKAELEAAIKANADETVLRSGLAMTEAKLKTARDAADAAEKALTKAKSDMSTAMTDREKARSAADKLKSAAENWPIADCAKSAKKLLAEAGLSGVSIENQLQSAHNSRADTLPWSAVYVGSVIRKAAIKLGLEATVGGKHVGKDGLLKMTSRHAEYVMEARRGIEGRYAAFDPAKRSVQIGDIIVSDRKEFIHRSGVKTIKGVASGDILHGDIVVLVNVTKRFAETIGGNVHNSVRRRRYPVDNKGNLVQDEKVLYDQEGNDGAFSGTGLTLSGEAPTLLQPRSTFRIFALLSPKAKCVTASKQAG